jgi:uncharacterized protein
LKKIADSGLIIAALDDRDEWHAWAKGVLQREEPPWLVCEPVLTEIAAGIGSAEPVLELLNSGDIEVAFELAAHKRALLTLTRKYRDQGMDLADACVVRMSEVFRDSIVYTVDKKDFSVYRRLGNRVIRCVFPE